MNEKLKFITLLSSSSGISSESLTGTHSSGILRFERKQVVLDFHVTWFLLFDADWIVQALWFGV